MPGYIGEFPKELICLKCYMCVADPIINLNRTIMCRTCVNASEILDTPPKEILDILAQYSMSCWFCTWKGLYSEYADHKKCHSIFPCRYCKLEFKSEDDLTIHLQTCDNYPVPCLIRNCPGAIRNLYTDHFFEDYHLLAIINAKLDNDLKSLFNNLIVHSSYLRKEDLRWLLGSLNYILNSNDYPAENNGSVNKIITLLVQLSTITNIHYPIYWHEIIDLLSQSNMVNDVKSFKADQCRDNEKET